MSSPAHSTRSRAPSISFPYTSYTERETDCEGLFFEGHHRHESRVSHDAHHARIPKALYPPLDVEQVNENGVVCEDTNRKHHGKGHEHHHHHHHAVNIGCTGNEDEQEGSLDGVNRIGGRRQVVGILVSQVFSLTLGL